MRETRFARLRAPPVNTLPPPARSSDHESSSKPTPLPETVRLLTPTEWTEAVATFERSSIFHSAAWLTLLQSSYHYTPILACLGPKEAPQALLPFMEISSLLTGRRGVSLPFTDDCEPLARSPEAAKALLHATLALAKTRKWRKIEFRGGSELLPDATPATTFYSHHLELKASEAILAKGMESSVRRAIRKAEQAGVTVEFSNQPAAIETFYQLLALTRRRHGLPPQPFHFFSGLQHRLLASGRGTVALARLNGEAIAGAVYLFSGQTVLYKYGASDERHQQVRGNNLVMWRALTSFAQQGYTRLDFGRTSLENEGLRAFKLSWGSSERVCHYLVHELASQRWIQAPDRAAGWHTTVFRQLPLPVARLVGNLIYRHLG